MFRLNYVLYVAIFDLSPRFHTRVSFTSCPLIFKDSDYRVTSHLDSYIVLHRIWEFPRQVCHFCS